MFELFQIFTTGGIVLWSKTNGNLSTHHPAVESLISDFLISEKSTNSDQDLDDFYRNDTHTIRYSRVNSLGIIFVCVYQSILQLSYAEELVSNVKTLFLSLFKNLIQTSNDQGEPFPQNLNFQKFDSYFDTRVAELEKVEESKKAQLQETPQIKSKSDEIVQNGDSHLKSNHSYASIISNTLSESEDDTSTPGTLTPTQGSSSLPPGLKKKSRRGGKNKNKASKNQSMEGNDALKKKQPKKMRKWTSDGMVEEYEDDESDEALDFSSKRAKALGGSDISSVPSSDALSDLNMSNYGKSNTQGNFLVNSLSDEMSEILKENNPQGNIDENEKSESSGSKLSFGFLQNFIGGKTLTPEDLQNTLDATRTHLMEKNVAPEVADHLCETVKTTLKGSKTKNWTSIQSTVQTAMADALRRILTPNTSEDLLFEIRKKERANKSSRDGSFDPYVISVVGVNGVGKSTNLSKIAFWLLQNRFKVLIAACDTFRSGAVEQLRVHVDRLRELTERNNAGHIDMFEEGYGKDAAVIAHHAIEYGRKHKYDIVLIDTAGRRHNDDRLMSSLEKFGKLANPDKIVMVGEALVGTDSVQQARNFNAAFGPNRNLDFFLISKCDTVGEMVGSLVNMTYSTGIPVLFVGTGQNYTDLRTLSVEWAVQLLMK